MEVNVEKNSLTKLQTYIEHEDYKGWDPFDGLNSRIFQNTFLRHNKLFRLAWLQLFKRSPVNLRPLFNVEKGHNPKGLGLFLTGYCNLFQLTQEHTLLSKIAYLKDKVIDLQTKGYSGACWGYNFDWQAKAFFQPKNTPTIVATTFISYALMDAYDVLKDESLLKAARSSCDFVLKDLNKSYDKAGNFAFSYSPLDKTQIFNASLLGARLLSRVYSYTREEELIDNAKKTVQYCVNHQKNDGSWAYGTLPHHQWIDSFHTGYNLECLGEYSIYAQDDSYSENIAKGLKYYLETFFTPDGIAKYYSNKVYPVDIHAPAQLIVTLSRLKKVEPNRQLLERVVRWTIDHMQDKKGYFYFRKNKYFTNKIPYIRWSQAWMFYALSFYIKEMIDE